MIMDESYREDLIEQIENLKESEIPKEVGFNKKQILEDEKLLDKLWTLYQKSVQEYDVDPDYAVLDALTEATGKNHHAPIVKTKKTCTCDRHAIYESIRHEYLKKDAERHVSEWQEDHDDFIVDNTRIDWDHLIEAYEKEKDCNVAENVTWDQVVDRYMYNHMGYRPDITM